MKPFRRAVGALLVLASFGGRLAAAPFQVEAAVTISRQPQFYHGWPSVAGRGDRLYLVYSGGREDHVCPFGRVELACSNDGGRTWSWPRVLHDSPIDDRDAGILLTRRGTILVSSYSSLAYQQHLAAPERRMNRIFGADVAAHLQRWRAAEIATTPEEKQALRRMWMMRSTDQGLTWSAPYPMPCYSPHGPAELADGTLLFAGADGKRAGAWISTDDGQSWTLRSELPGAAGEVHGVQAADGTIVVQIRNRTGSGGATAAPAHGVEGGGGWGVFQTESRDEGRTWSALRRLDVVGYPSHLLRTSRGELVMTYGVRRAPQGIRARVSRDHGQTWGGERVLTADGATDDLGYPATVERADGQLVTVWYEVRPPDRLAVLRQAVWFPGDDPEMREAPRS